MKQSVKEQNGHRDAGCAGTESGRRAWRRLLGIFLICGISGIILLGGCREKTDSMAKIKDVEFTVVAEENIPEELLKVLKERKAEGFKITYMDAGFLYVCMGYGEQEMGGYTITVDEFYETENAVYFNTTLVGPDPGSTAGKKNVKSYPYIVAKMENNTKPVVFV